jgi:hypothetical protein
MPKTHSSPQSVNRVCMPLSSRPSPKESRQAPRPSAGGTPSLTTQICWAYGESGVSGTRDTLCMHGSENAWPHVAQALSMSRCCKLWREPRGFPSYYLARVPHKQWYVLHTPWSVTWHDVCMQLWSAIPQYSYVQLHGATIASRMVGAPVRRVQKVLIDVPGPHHHINHLPQPRQSASNLQHEQRMWRLGVWGEQGAL